jgi:hypothetical protein
MRESRSKSLSRGDFLKVAGVFSAAGVIAACRLEAAATPTPPNHTSGKQEQRLQTEFDLTALNAQAFWLFIDNRNHHLGRKNIASQLNISRNNLKDHITRIIRHVQKQGNPGVTTLNDAVNVAVNNLGLG